MNEEEKQALDKVIIFARHAHEGQKRKYTPDDYIVHPIRVMQLCRKYTDVLSILAAAVLHDVLEDTSVTKDGIAEFLQQIMTVDEAKQTLNLVIDLTDVYIKKDYPQWNRRRRKAAEQERLIGTSADSQTIKYADIYDNCDEITTHDPDFARVFLSECKMILKKLDKGNKELYKAVTEKVERKLGEIRRK